MAYTVATLIKDAYSLSGLVASDGLQTVTGAQMIKGLRMLNAFISTKSVNERLIPYFTQYEFSAVVEQESYFVPNLIYAETLTFNYQSVRYSLNSMSRKEYFGTDRANGIASLMFDYRVERCKGGSNLFMYFLPDSDYPCTIWGKFSLGSVVLNQDLESTLDLFYINYLKYGVGSYICNDRNITFQPQNQRQLDEYEQQFMDISAPDLTLTKVSGLQGKMPSRWGIVNLSGGWVP